MLENMRQHCAQLFKSNIYLGTKIQEMHFPNHHFFVQS